MVCCKECIFVDPGCSVGRSVGIEIAGDYNVHYAGCFGQVITSLQFWPEVFAVPAILLPIAHCQEQFVLRYGQFELKGLESVLMEIPPFLDHDCVPDPGDDPSSSTLWSIKSIRSIVCMHCKPRVWVTFLDPCFCTGYYVIGTPHL